MFLGYDARPHDGAGLERQVFRGRVLVAHQTCDRLIRASFELVLEELCTVLTYDIVWTARSPASWINRQSGSALFRASR